MDIQEIKKCRLVMNGLKKREKVQEQTPTKQKKKTDGGNKGNDRKKPTHKEKESIKQPTIIGKTGKWVYDDNRKAKATEKHARKQDRGATI